MISEFTKDAILKAIENPKEYGSGALRKQLQAAYDKMLSEVSESLLGKPLESRMAMRQQLIQLSEKPPSVQLLLNMMRNEVMLFSKDYREHSIDIEKFLTNHVSHFIRSL
jgi:hypothetical protein